MLLRRPQKSGVGQLPPGIPQRFQRLHPFEELVGVEILQLPKAELQRRRLFSHGQMDFDAELAQHLIKIVPVHQDGISNAGCPRSQAPVCPAAEIPMMRIRNGVSGSSLPPGSSIVEANSTSIFLKEMGFFITAPFPDGRHQMAGRHNCSA